MNKPNEEEQQQKKLKKFLQQQENFIVRMNASMWTTQIGKIKVFISGAVRSRLSENKPFFKTETTNAI